MTRCTDSKRSPDGKDEIFIRREFVQTSENARLAFRVASPVAVEMFKRVDKDFCRHQDNQQITEKFEKQHEFPSGGGKQYYQPRKSTNRIYAPR